MNTIIHYCSDFVFITLYFDKNNNMDTNICIRTITLNDNTLNFSAGGGVVYDSVPIDEYYESLQKVSIFIKFFSNGDYKW